MKKKREIIVFSVVFVIAIISTIFFLNPHYSIDTVEFMNVGYESYVNSKFLVDGRIFSMLLLKLVINYPMKYVIPVTYVIGILISSASVMYIRKWILEQTNGEEKIGIFETMISYVIIFNFMYIDAFQFMEFPIIALSVLLYIISAKILVKKEKNYVIKSTLLTIIAMFCYQGTINVFITIGFIFSIIKNNKINKELIFDIIKIGMLTLIATIINYVFTEIVGGTDRLEFNIIENLAKGIISLFMITFRGNSHYPKYLQLIFAILIICYCLFKKVKILNLICIYGVSIGANILLLMTSSGGIVCTNQWGRVFFSIGAAIGYLFMYLWCVEKEIRRDKIIKVFLIIYFVSLLIVYFKYTYLYMRGQYIDKYIITNIDNIITQYEEETGNKIEKYAYSFEREDYNVLDTLNILNKNYENMDYITILRGRRTIEGISSTLFEIYSNRKIERTLGELGWKEKYFENIDFSDLKQFDENRFVFDGNTVYIIF